MIFVGNVVYKYETLITRQPLRFFFQLFFAIIYRLGANRIGHSFVSSLNCFTNFSVGSPQRSAWWKDLEVGSSFQVISGSTGERQSQLCALGKRERADCMPQWVAVGLYASEKLGGTHPELSGWVPLSTFPAAGAGECLCVLLPR